MTDSNRKPFKFTFGSSSAAPQPFADLGKTFATPAGGINFFSLKSAPVRSAPLSPMMVSMIHRLQGADLEAKVADTQRSLTIPQVHAAVLIDAAKKGGLGTVGWEIERQYVYAGLLIMQQKLQSLLTQPHQPVNAQVSFSHGVQAAQVMLAKEEAPALLREIGYAIDRHFADLKEGSVPLDLRVNPQVQMLVSSLRTPSSPGASGTAPV